MILRSTKGSALTYDEMDNNLVYLDTTKVDKTSNETIAGMKTFSAPINGNLIGNATTATKLIIPRKINGVAFDGTTDIVLPAQSLSGVTITDFAQTFKGEKTFSDGLITDISGNSKTANALKVGRKINGVVFDGTADIQLPTADQSNFCTISTDQTISGLKTFNISPLAPTPTTTDNSTKIATTAFVKAVVAGVGSSGSGAQGPQGPQGPAGPQGPQGLSASGSVTTKVVSGTLLCSNGYYTAPWFDPWGTAQDFGEIFPPAGYTMANFVGGNASIQTIYFAGVVNADDVLYCKGYALASSIRIVCGNSEQRQAGIASYTTIWQK
jgi:hypothetical protein